MALGRRQLVAGAGAAGLASGLAMPAIAQNKPIRMGWIAAVSGMFASNAQAQDWGFRMAVADLNEQGGLLGRPIEIIMRDSAADPSKAVSFAKELVYNEKVDVVCGPINSGEVLPTLGVISGGKTLQMVGGVIDELIDQNPEPLEENLCWGKSRTDEDPYSDIPPDTSMRCPFTQRLSSESCAAIVGPTSFGTP